MLYALHEGDLNDQVRSHLACADEANDDGPRLFDAFGQIGRE